MNCTDCSTELVPGQNCSKKQYKRAALHNKNAWCNECVEKKEPKQKIEHTKNDKRINGKPRCKAILPGPLVATADTIEACQVAANSIATTLPPTAKIVLFLDLHNTFDLLIEYSKRGMKELDEVRNLLAGTNVVIVTFVGWDNKMTQIAIQDIIWAMQVLSIDCGLAVSERNHGGETVESQFFTGGKGWVIDLVTKSQRFPAGAKWYFADDSKDHLMSVKIMNPHISAEPFHCQDIDKLWNWITELKKN